MQERQKYVQPIFLYVFYSFIMKLLLDILSKLCISEYFKVALYATYIDLFNKYSKVTIKYCLRTVIKFVLQVMKSLLL